MTANQQGVPTGEPAPGTGAQPVPWARQSARTEPVTNRMRRKVDGLPDWEPLPPGEILVQRRGRG
jgi:hypothetical protein